MNRPNTTSTLKDFTMPREIISEYWQPSVQIRWFEYNQRIVSDGNYGVAKAISDKKLQQLHTSNLGNREWKDVPTETES